MLQFIAEATTQPTDWTVKIGMWAGIATVAIAALSALILFALSKYREIRLAIKNLAISQVDAATDVNGLKNQNVSPGTLPTLTNIASGGTGDGTKGTL